MLREGDSSLTTFTSFRSSVVRNDKEIEGETEGGSNFHEENCCPPLLSPNHTYHPE